MPLTEIQARNSKPRERAYKMADGEGLFLFVQPNGSKLWRMKYRFAGKEKLLSFGAYPDLGIYELPDTRCRSEWKPPHALQRIKEISKRFKRIAFGHIPIDYLSAVSGSLKFGSLA